MRDCGLELFEFLEEILNLSDIVVVPWLKINGTSKGKLQIIADLGCLCFSVWQNLNSGVQQLERRHFPSF